MSERRVWRYGLIKDITPACECGALVHDGPHEHALEVEYFFDTLRRYEPITLPDSWQLVYSEVKAWSDRQCEIALMGEP